MSIDMLTSGSARRLYGALSDEPAMAALLEAGVVVQMLDLKAIAAGTPKEKFRVTLSDGVHSVKAMLGPKFTEDCKSGAIATCALVKLTNASAVPLAGGVIVVVKDFEVISAGGAESSMIGEPTFVTAADMPVEAAAEPKAEPVAEAVAEPTAEAAAESTAVATAEPVTETAVEPMAETAAEPMAETAAEPTADTAVEPTAEAAAEPATEAEAQPFEAEPMTAEPASEPMALEPMAVDSPPKPSAPAAAAAAADNLATPAAKPKREREDDSACAQLASGAVQALFDAAGDKAKVGKLLAEAPMLQAIDVKRIAGTVEKFRLCISDGSHYITAVVSPKLNALLRELQPNGTLKVTDGVCSIIAGKRVLVISGLELVSAAPLVAGRVGEPLDVERAALGETMKTPSAHGPAGGFLGGSLTASRVQPISSLHPQVRAFAIKGRLTVLEEPRAYQRGDRAGKVQTIQIADETDEIRITLWAEAVEAYGAILQEGSAYVLSSARPGCVRMANKKYSTLSNSYELSLGEGARIERLAEEEGSAGRLPPMLTLLDVVPLAQLTAKPAQSSCDVAAVVLEVGALVTIQRKAGGGEMTKRTVVIADSSGCKLELSLWDAHADKLTEAHAPNGDAAGAGGVTVVTVKGARVSEWNSRSLSTGRGSRVEVNPQRGEADELRAWWAARDPAAELTALSVNERAGGAGGDRPSERLALGELSIDSAAMLTAESQGKPLYVSTRLYLAQLQTNEGRPLWYAACPGCSRKLSGDESTSWRCESCAKPCEQADYRYILSAMALDHSGRAWLSIFNEQGIKLLGQTAGELKSLREVSEQAFESAFAAVRMSGPYSARLRAKKEEWNGESKMRINALELSPLDYAAEAALLLADIKGARI